MWGHRSARTLVAFLELTHGHDTRLGYATSLVNYGDQI